VTPNLGDQRRLAEVGSGSASPDLPSCSISTPEGLRRASGRVSATV